MSGTIRTLKTKALAVLMGLAAPLVFGDPSEELLAFTEVEGAKLLSIGKKVFPDE